ncbi:MAG: putative Na+/H+ antiporter [Verrucomicrobiales bacterium]|nr:putative Na+/H+ antiporter [Verrucomicrobiales bacterium]
MTVAHLQNTSNSPRPRVGSVHRFRWPLWIGLLFLLCVGLPEAALAAAHPAAPAIDFPPPLSGYQDSGASGVLEILKRRVEQQPFNLWATLLFLGAVIHTFVTHKFRHLAHVFEERHALGAAERVARGEPAGSSSWARLFHFLGEVEAVFGVWVLPLVLLITLEFGSSTAVHYINHVVNYQEAMFVVVIMAISSTRPVLALAEAALRWVAGLGGGGPTAWWFSILTIGPTLGSFITEPAAMTISAALLAKQFYHLKPRPALAYASLGLLFVNVSIGGTLTHFAAPPVLMVAGAWGWDTPFMFLHFGWKSLLSILISNGIYYLVFRKDFALLSRSEAASSATSVREASRRPVPVWITLCHLSFMAFAVLNAHNPAITVGTLLFFMAFFEVTQDHQTELQLRPAILVGFFLAALVIHGGLQAWWIAPVLGSLSEVPLMIGAVFLTAFNDNAAITFLSTLVPNLSEGMKYAVVAGAVAGGGLTVIANAPNPAGQSLLNRFFQDGVSPLRLFLGALLPTVVTTVVYLSIR